MVYVVVRVRGCENIRGTINDTLKMLKLTKVNHCVLVSETVQNKGMLKKAKDYITWGEIDEPTLTKLIKERGRLIGDKEITDKYLKSNSKFENIPVFANAIITQNLKYTAVKAIKPVLRLHPPRSGYDGIKRTYVLGGALGYRGKGINELIKRML